MPPKKKHGRSLFEFISPTPSNDEKLTSEILKKTLQNVFGYKTFRPLQFEVMKSLTIDGKDCVCILPTGAGKSMLYQLPAIAYKSGIVVVVSPLIALMKDQVDSLQMRDIAAEALHSELTIQKKNSILQQVSYPVGPKIKILFVTPEYLTSDKSDVLIGNLVKNNFLKFFAIDESHCISEWGNSFRSSFLRLGMLKRKYPKIPIIALTATATPKVRDDIVRILKLNDPKIFVSSFNRPEITFFVRYKDSLYKDGVTVKEDILSYINSHKEDCGIIYCRRKEDCDEIADLLQRNNLSAESFHSGLNKAKKKEVQEGFQSNKYKVVVCTIAFGMGIDKPDVRYVIHYELSKSLESFSQESGRAARDGQPAESIIYYSSSDADKIKFLIEQEHLKSRDEVRREMLRKFQSMINFCTTVKICRRKILLEYFGETHTTDCCNKKCDVCIFPNDDMLRSYGVSSGSSFKRARMNQPPMHKAEAIFVEDEDNCAIERLTTRQKNEAILERECFGVSQRVNIKESDSIDDIFSKFEADEKKYNPSFSRNSKSLQSKKSTLSRSETISTQNAIGFAPASLLKRKATTQIAPKRKSPYER